MGGEEIAKQKEIELIEKENYLITDSCFFWLFEKVNMKRLGLKTYDYFKEEIIKEIIYFLRK